MDEQDTTTTTIFGAAKHPNAGRVVTLTLNDYGFGTMPLLVPVPEGAAPFKGNKIAAIKWVREATGLGLVEAKHLTDAVLTAGPVTVIEDVAKNTYDELRSRYEQLQDNYRGVTDELWSIRRERNAAESKATTLEEQNKALRLKVAKLQGQVELLLAQQGTDRSIHDATLVGLGEQIGRLKAQGGFDGDEPVFDLDDVIDRLNEDAE